MILVDIYKEKNSERVLYRLIKERAKEDDPFMTWAERAAPSRERYTKIIKSRPYYKWLLIKSRRAYIGVVLVLKNNEVGIILFQRYRSSGYGSQALAMLLDQVKPQPKVSGGNFRARIHPQNFRSIRLFEKAGFAHTHNMYQLKR